MVQIRPNLRWMPEQLETRRVISLVTDIKLEQNDENKETIQKLKARVDKLIDHYNVDSENVRDGED